MRELIEKLASALDADDWDAVRATLADEVRYEVAGETLVGPDAVVASYSSASRSAHELFDLVAYDHGVVSEDGAGTFVIDYTDDLTIDGDTLVHNARQAVTVDVGTGLVTRIVNVELPGEREAVDEFLRRHGKSR